MSSRRFMMHSSVRVLTTPSHEETSADAGGLAPQECVEYGTRARTDGSQQAQEGDGPDPKLQTQMYRRHGLRCGPRARRSSPDAHSAGEGKRPCRCRTCE